MKKLMGLVILLVLIFGNASNAQAVRNTKEATDNRQALKIGKEQLKKDSAQLVAFRTKVKAFEKAFYNKMPEKVKTLKMDIMTDMQREVEQSERKIVQDKNEVGESSAELGASNRESRRSRVSRANNGAQAGEGRMVRDDRRDKRDDRRDKKDDQADLQNQIARTNRQKQILSTLKSFTFSFEASEKEKAVANIKLMNEFIQTMEADIIATKAELAEDKQEQREDRRERREDKRTRRVRRNN